MWTSYGLLSLTERRRGAAPTPRFIARDNAPRSGGHPAGEGRPGQGTESLYYSHATGRGFILGTSTSSSQWLMHRGSLF